MKAESSSESLRTPSSSPSENFPMSFSNAGVSFNPSVLKYTGVK